ncbi:MAG: type II toxin-antitoxin system RatA family toxin, partial [Pseudolabrys sp.]
MPQFSTKRRVPHSAANMFDLVADVERYPEFVPMCSAMHVRNTTDKGEGVTVMVASMTVAYKMIRQTFTSRATLDKPNLKILVEYLDGPFRHMQNRWAFNPTSDNT